MSKSNSSMMTIEVDFLAGTTLIDAVYEAKIKARMWDLAYIKFNFNGVKISVSASTPMIVEEFLMGRYLAALKSESKYIII